MVTSFRQLATNYRFIFKLIELVFAIICLGLLTHDDSYLVPRWVWLLYCTNSVTYIIILITISVCYVFGENCELLDSIMSTIGIPLYIVAGLTAIVRSTMYIPDDAENDSCELAFGILFIVSGSLMVSQVSWTMYANNRRVEEHE